MQSTASQICEILDAKLVAGSGAVQVKGFFTDSRKPLAGGLFLALKGENFNGDAQRSNLPHDHGD